MKFSVLFYEPREQVLKQLLPFAITFMIRDIYRFKLSETREKSRKTITADPAEIMTSPV